jgi:outer membrane protein assembly factor BamB
MRAMCRYCIDGQSGKLIWQYGTAAMMRASFNFSESPTTGNTTVVFGSNDFNVSSALLESCLICVV